MGIITSKFVRNEVMTTESQFTKLPFDIMENIMEFLEDKKIGIIMQLNKQFYNDWYIESQFIKTEHRIISSTYKFSIDNTFTGHQHFFNVITLNAGDYLISNESHSLDMMRAINPGFLNS